MRFPLKVGIIGTGFMGKIYADILSKTVDTVVLCSNDEATCKQLSEQYGCKYYLDYREMFKKEQLDVAAICLPTNLHCKVSCLALEYGINVLCEKPFATNESEALQMIEKAKENNKLLMVAHCLRFSREYEYIKRCISDGRFGELKSINTFREHIMPNWSAENWLSNIAVSGGILRDLHIHDTDMIVGWFGAPISVYTQGGEQACRTLYNYADGKVVSSSASWRDIKGYEDESGYEAFFERATVKNLNGKITVQTDDGCFDPLEKEAFGEFYGADIYENEIKYFCSCVTSGTEPEICLPCESLKSFAVNCTEFKSRKNHTAAKIGK